MAIHTPQPDERPEDEDCGRKDDEVAAFTAGAYVADVLGGEGYGNVEEGEGGECRKEEGLEVVLCER